jgi:hypothetical protein
MPWKFYPSIPLKYCATFILLKLWEPVIQKEQTYSNSAIENRKWPQGDLTEQKWDKSLESHGERFSSPQITGKVTDFPCRFYNGIFFEEKPGMCSRKRSEDCALFEILVK